MNNRKAVKAPPEKPKKKIPRSDTPVHTQECSKSDFEYFMKNPGGVKNLGRGGKQPRHPNSGHSPGGPAAPLHGRPRHIGQHNPAKRREYVLLTPYYTGAGPGYLPKSRWQEVEDLEHRFIPRWEMEDMLADRAREALAKLPTQAQAAAAAARKAKLRKEQEAEAQARATMERARIEAERAKVGAEAKARFEAQLARQAAAAKKTEVAPKAIAPLPKLPVEVKQVTAAESPALPATGVPNHLKGFLARKLEETLSQQALTPEKKAKLVAWAWETKGLRITL